jgi:hypothetical protein
VDPNGKLSNDIYSGQLRTLEEQTVDGRLRVESECGAVAVGRTYLLPPLSSGGASLVRPWLRFHTHREGMRRFRDLPALAAENKEKLGLFARAK